MARIRYLKTLEQVKQAAESSSKHLKSTVQSIRAVYQSDPELVKAVVPRPLEPCSSGEVIVTLSNVTIHISPEFNIGIGSGIFGVRVKYDGKEGCYLLTMPMTSEAAVVGGRETYGEPKKLAEISFQKQGEKVRCEVSRMGIPYIAANGSIQEEIGAREFTEYAYCYKALPACDKVSGFEADPLLVELEWKHKHTYSAKLDGKVELKESPFDPVADLPVRQLVKLEYEEGSSESTGRIIRGVPMDWLLPFWHQRYDDPSHVGVEVTS